MIHDDDGWMDGWKDWVDGEEETSNKRREIVVVSLRDQVVSELKALILTFK